MKSNLIHSLFKLASKARLLIFFCNELNISHLRDTSLVAESVRKTSSSSSFRKWKASKGVRADEHERRAAKKTI